MTLNIEGTKISDVEIIDDRKETRDSMALPVKDLNLNPVKYAGPIWDVEKFIQEIRKTAQAAIFDHHLRVQKYSTVNGGEIVARLYQNRFPALLCTRWQAADIDEMRPLRRYIPVLVNPDELTPDTIKEGFRRCLEEFRGEFREDRRPWRTLIRIEDVITSVHGAFFYFFVPAWSSDSGFRLPLSVLPEAIQPALKLPHRMHAFVNLGADSAEQLFFDGWQK